MCDWWHMVCLSSWKVSCGEFGTSSPWISWGRLDLKHRSLNYLKFIAKWRIDQLCLENNLFSLKFYVFFLCCNLCLSLSVRCQGVKPFPFPSCLGQHSQDVPFSVSLGCRISSAWLLKLHDLNNLLVYCLSLLVRLSFIHWYILRT